MLVKISLCTFSFSFNFSNIATNDRNYSLILFSSWARIARKYYTAGNLALPCHRPIRCSHTPAEEAVTEGSIILL